MPSFQIAVEPSRKAAARFVLQVRRSLQKAFVEEQTARGLSQSEIARLIKVHRSVINRELKGVKDITLGRVGELSWAMGRVPSFSIENPVRSSGTNTPPLPVQPISNVPSPPPPMTVLSTDGISMVSFATAA
jgi:Helix-turn-helix domain